MSVTGNFFPKIISYYHLPMSVSIENKIAYCNKRIFPSCVLRSKIVDIIKTITVPENSQQRFPFAILQKTSINSYSGIFHENIVFRGIYYRIHPDMGETARLCVARGYFFQNSFITSANLFECWNFPKYSKIDW